ncbi:uncharacterized protein MELLADRAFT_92216 [Melampsora larici-populina 98AG31]|uniref:Uncharacterized protein n=1 Tax=Melampsora larici-populina (strain 98AG31 / pathotype 3-4-7) TaxID=747676 RepID=F4R8U0_MELLP|nr:uncharacterized protein MELLADRAFT_92216 [Melampsora larici-populina 98AG31]EGG10869.1 hypothetical protein MELLADRAFT_92216 [Melampsora larici-populina 98AG31]
MLTTAGAYSKGALELFQANLCGRSPRGFGLQCQRIGAQIIDKFHIDNVLPVVAWLKQSGYSGPVSAGTEQAVCVKALRYNEGCLVGVEGGDVKVVDLEHLKTLIKDAVEGDCLCKKIRAYTIQVPLPNIPTFVVALISSREDESAEDIKAQHLKFIHLLESAEIPLISLGSDGAASEVLAQELLVNAATNYLDFSAPELKVNVRFPLLGASKQPVVAVQDPKHARKTASNQLLSGPCLLAFGQFNINLDQLLILLKTKNCPLGYKDILNTDKQDDGHAYQTFSKQTFKAACSDPECVGLVLYLYIFGKLVDSWLNQRMPHQDRIISSYTVVFFVCKWKVYLPKRQKEPGSLMNLSSNCISHHSICIFEQLGESLLGLIIAHRKRYPNHPLMPWNHGTECCEQIFGWMRVLLPTFTVLDARQVKPKIFAVIKCIMSGYITLPTNENLHSGKYLNIIPIIFAMKLISDLIGYQYNFSRNNIHDYTLILSQYPSNNEIHQLLKVAESWAQELAMFAGITTNNMEAPVDDNVCEQAFGEDQNDVLVSIHKRSCLTYPLESETINVEQALETAAGLTSQHQEADVLMSRITESHEDQVLKDLVNNVMLQIGKSQLLEVNIASSTAPKSLVNTNGTLNTDSMTSDRKLHDSQVQTHHGPERPRVASKDLPVPQYNPDTSHEVMSPSQYSKAVSFYWQSQKDPEYGEARKNCWITHGKRKFHDPTDTQDNTTVTEPEVSGTQARNSQGVDSIGIEYQYQQGGTGEITAKTPLTKDKWVVVVKQDHNTGKHAWVQEAQSPTKLSYVSLEIYCYSPGQTMIQAAHQKDLPNKYTFSHLPAKYIDYLFSPEGDDSGFVMLGTGQYQVPEVFVELIATLPAWQRPFLPKTVKKSGQRRVRKAVEK